MNLSKVTTIIIVVFLGINELASTGACIVLALRHTEIPAMLASIAFGSFAGLLGLLKSAHSGDDPVISDAQIDAVGDKVVKAMNANQLK